MPDFLIRKECLYKMNYLGTYCIFLLYAKAVNGVRVKSVNAGTAELIFIEEQTT